MMVVLTLPHTNHGGAKFLVSKYYEHMSIYDNDLDLIIKTINTTQYNKIITNRVYSVLRKEYLL